jgi:hypothetical protein
MTTRNVKSRFSLLHASAWGLLLLLLLAACNFPTDGDCAPEDMAAPINIVPSNGDVVGDLSPMVTWDYAGACIPDTFDIELWDVTEAEAVEVQSATVDGFAVSWTPSSPLTPASIYNFYIMPASGSTTGQQAWARFRTGPICAADTAPTLLSPADGTVISEVVEITDTGTGEVIATSPRFTMMWEGTSGCVPAEGYEIQVSRISTFPPSATRPYSMYGNRMMFFFPPGVEWHDCETYYWRVIPLLAGGVGGPPSEVWSFNINTSGLFCPPDLQVLPVIPELEIAIPPSGLITGYVWHDLCATPYEGSGVVPPGCIEMPDGSIEADGVYDDTTEPGIQGVTVHLGSGPCPSTGLATDITSVIGAYAFMELSGGTYCVTVDSLNDGNDLILIPGKWTYYDRGLNPQQLTISIEEHHAAPWVNFGWDYQFLPAPVLVSPTPTTTPESMEGMANANARCRYGPLLVYKTIAYLNEGDPVTIEGRNFSGSWLWILRPGSSDHCWVADNLIDWVGDTDSLPVIEPPPTPTPKPSPTPKPTMTPTSKPYK